jgi:DNA-directed RNA polymerase subunit M/transcription elongation factor TFIIS
LKVQIVSKYLALAEEGLVQKMDCPLCQGLLMPNLDLNDIIYIYCLSCQYRNNIGIVEYERIEKAVREQSN